MVDLDVFSENSEVVWSGWLSTSNKVDLYCIISVDNDIYDNDIYLYFAR